MPSTIKPLTFLVTDESWYWQSGTMLSPVYLLPSEGRIERSMPANVISAAMSGQLVELRLPTKYEYTKYLEPLVNKYNVIPLTMFSPDEEEEEEEAAPNRAH